MKVLTMFILCFLLLPALPACDEALPGSPINVIGDVFYVCPMDTDSVYVYIQDWGHNEIIVYRYYDENYTVKFTQDLYETTEMVVVTLPSGNVYVLQELKSKGQDDMEYSCSFVWSGDDYRYSEEG